MRVTLRFDSAHTEEVRSFALAMNRVGLTAQLTVGLNGPHKWCGSTPALTTEQFATVVSVLSEDGARFEDSDS